MSKKETKILRFIAMGLIGTLLGADTKVALLSSIESNAKVRLLYRNIPLGCEPFGVIPLERMASSASDPQGCQKEIEGYYASHPGDKHFASTRLRLHQSYHFTMIAKGCVLYANGPESYSEMLLVQGLALIDPAFDEREWNVRLRRAQQGAEKHKKGLHDTRIRTMCIKKER